MPIDESTWGIIPYKITEYCDYFAIVINCTVIEPVLQYTSAFELHPVMVFL